jgi:transposase-like protein
VRKSLTMKPTEAMMKKRRKKARAMYVNGMGFRGIERITGVHHTTIINWVKSVGKFKCRSSASSRFLRLGMFLSKSVAVYA